MKFWGITPDAWDRESFDSRARMFKTWQIEALRAVVEQSNGGKT